ncbi:MAG: hypothetical protein LBS30_03240 [Planctomycetota bacterium]|jgi:hypothetical protein|nr:hypothetical protein [Planctomycetota bacterium]
MRMRLWLAAVAVFGGMAFGGDAAVADAEAGTGGNLSDFFNAAAVRPPLPGDWVEYRVAFPVDQLENSLRPNPAPPPGGPEEPDPGGGSGAFTPMFELPAAWRVLPLRLEVREVTDDGCNVILTFTGMSHPMFLAHRDEGAAGAEFHYDPPVEGDDRRIFVKVGGEEMEVEMVRRRSGDGEGFIRWVNAQLPFGIVRFATPDVDFMLAGYGRGQPPDFPLDAPGAIDPPLGKLWQSE